MHQITKKDRPLRAEHFKEFEKCFGAEANGRSKRKVSDSIEGRWRSFGVAEVRDRSYKLDGLKWLKDDTIDDADDLPEPEELVADAIGQLEGAVAEMNAVLKLLENGDLGPRARAAICQKDGQKSHSFPSSTTPVVRNRRKVLFATNRLTGTCACCKSGTSVRNHFHPTCRCHPG